MQKTTEDAALSALGKEIEDTPGQSTTVNREQIGASGRPDPTESSVAKMVKGVAESTKDESVENEVMEVKSAKIDLERLPMVVLIEEAAREDLEAAEKAMEAWKAALDRGDLGAAELAMKEVEKLSPGRKKLLNFIIADPDLYRKDMERFHISIGNKPPLPVKAGDTAEMRREAYSESLRNYIYEKNPELKPKVDRSRIDEVLYSLTQQVNGDFEQTRHDVTPPYPWEMTTTKSVYSMKFEEKGWFAKPNVLVASIKTTRIYTNSADPEAKPIHLTYETQVKHDLTGNDVKFNYILIIDGKKEEWDPTVQFTHEKFNELFALEPEVETFRQKLTLEGYEKLNEDIHRMENDIPQFMDEWKGAAEINPRGYMTARMNKYRFTITKKGDVFVHVPVNEFARGEERKTDFAVQLFSNGKSLIRKNEKSIFPPQVYPALRASQIGVFSSDTEQISFQNGERKVLENIHKFTLDGANNYKHIVTPQAVRSFQLDGTANSSNFDGVVMSNVGNTSLKGKVLNFEREIDPNNKEIELKQREGDFNKYKRYAVGLLEGLAEFHGAGLYHRQIRPDSLRLQYESVKLANFKFVASEDDSEISSSGLDENDPYRALEAEVLEAGAARDAALKAADLYSVGVCLFELSHGPLSSVGEEVAAFKAKYADALPESANDRIILQLLNDDPAMRGSAREVLAKLQNLQFTSK